MEILYNSLRIHLLSRYIFNCCIILSSMNFYILLIGIIGLIYKVYFFLNNHILYVHCKKKLLKSKDLQSNWNLRYKVYLNIIYHNKNVIFSLYLIKTLFHWPYHVLLYPQSVYAHGLLWQPVFLKPLSFPMCHTFSCFDLANLKVYRTSHFIYSFFEHKPK